MIFICLGMGNPVPTVNWTSPDNEMTNVTFKAEPSSCGSNLCTINNKLGNRRLLLVEQFSLGWQRELCHSFGFVRFNNYVAGGLLVGLFFQSVIYSLLPSLPIPSLGPSFLFFFALVKHFSSVEYFYAMLKFLFSIKL